MNTDVLNVFNQLAIFHNTFIIKKYIGIIKNQKFAKGGSGILGMGREGILSGVSHSQGGVDLGEIGEGEGGEYFGIINKQMASKYSNELPDVFDSFWGLQRRLEIKLGNTELERIV